MSWKVLEINEFSGNLGLFGIWNDDCCSISLKFEIPSTFLGKPSWKLTQKCPGNDSRHLSGNPVLNLQGNEVLYGYF